MLAAKAAIIVGLALGQQLPPDHKVALVFADRTEIVRLVDAQAEFKRLDTLTTRTDEQAKRHAALHLALNTLFDLQRVRRDWEESGNEWKGPV